MEEGDTGRKREKREKEKKKREKFFYEEKLTGIWALSKMKKMLYMFYKIRKKALKIVQICLEFKMKRKKGGRKKSVFEILVGKKSTSWYYIYP